ncbi:WD40 repeat domain-containing protein [Aeromonas caviae]|jgi:WD40 repeat protein|uniref:PQQ-binding-like beta-propeller repeat protein n=1 Tax=Aeromonas caviae TaxID=648 RepID=A0AA37CUE7_AERCA|nr:PQQ-binding-like beta-propeller repeat protein [Aeromonas caviae]MBL0587035.1 PQQ-binding-like beta-propeller repeat protein [Aeromonas caviae]MCE9860593.1 PQQ-binding-like beta-propeller repeat protein [Aeromonas caviae]MCX4036946.1 PQQ-binding-like beta-propeller repeat protein [Aeromonas caviae]MDH0435126.1 PQQ-binding-like beta-propeller repeat protein [Aeromonas caviae]MDH0937972.1 PQQ-binding-like beta-propeller repeat protein [Aeromonas caviae]
MIKSAIYLIGICLMLTGCEQRSLPSQQIRLANQGLLSADLASSGKLALVSSLSQGTVVWDLEQGKERWRWRQSDDQEEFVTLTRFSPDDSHAITATQHTFAIWRLQDGRSQGYYSLPESPLRDAAISADGRQVLIGREDGKAEVVDTQTGRRLQFLGHTEQVNTVDLSPNGRYALTGGNDYSAYLWDTRTGQVVWRFNHAGRVVMARLDPSGRFAFTADSRQASIWDLKTGKEHSRLQYDHRFEVYTSARFANGGNWLITGAPSRQLTLWQVSDGQPLQSWRVSPHPKVKPPSAVVYGVALRDNDHLVSASSSGLAEIWTIK